MQKIPTLFIRGEDWLVTPQVQAGCEWVPKGEGVATEKLNGTNVLVVFHQDGHYTVHKRTNPTKEEKKLDIQPRNIPASREEPADKWIFEAVDSFMEGGMLDELLHPRGIYGPVWGEALGPKIQGNPYELDSHIWIPFMPPFITVIPDCPRDYESLRAFLKDAESRAFPKHRMEGLVFHTWYAKAKIKKRDFGRKEEF